MTEDHGSNPNDDADGTDKKRKDLLDGVAKKGSSRTNKVNQRGDLFRRSYLRAIGGVAGISLIPGIGAADASDTVEIIKGVSNGEERYTEVPEDWYEHFTQADEAFSELKALTRDEEWSAGRALARNPENMLLEDNDRIYHEYVLEVESKIPDVARDNTPDEINGIEVVVKEYCPVEDACEGGPTPDCSGDACYSDCRDICEWCMLGGHPLWNAGSLGCSISIPSSNGNIIASLHAVKDGDCSGAPDRDFCDSQDGIEICAGDDDCKEHVGEVVGYAHEYDAAWIETENNYQIQDTIYYAAYPVEGNLSRTMVCNLISWSTLTNKMGKETCNTGGTLSRVIEWQDDGDDGERTPCTDEVEWVDSCVPAWPGDSGGPHYWEDDTYDETWIVGFIKGVSRCCEDEDDPECDHDCGCDDWEWTRSNIGYGLNSDYGIEFGDGASC